MQNVEILQQGRWWKVIANDSLIGRYDSEKEAKDIASVCKHTYTWPPKSRVAGVYWHLGKWEIQSGERFTDISEAIAAAERNKKDNVDKITAGRDKCKKCVWRLIISSNSSGALYCCGYGLCLGHESRVYLHYKRVGKQTLEGFTTGENCTEFMDGDPRDKLSLLQDDVSKVTDAGWALLRRERGIETARQPQKRKPYKNTTTIDMERASQLRELHAWSEIAKAAEISVAGVCGAWQRKRINKMAAKRIKDAFGIDITVEGV